MISRRWFHILGAALALVLVVALYRAKTESQQARARVAALEAEIAQLRVDNRLLAAEEALLDDPARIERLARSRLGVEPPQPTPRRPAAP
jgi:cell division protein FtsL